MCDTLPAMPASGLRVAPLWRRFAAGAIDAVVVAVPTIAASVGAARLWMGHMRRRGKHGKGMPTLRADRGWRRVIAAVSQPLDVQARNWRSPGYRALGIRRVDARTGGPVTLRSAIIRSAVTGLWGHATRSLVRPWQARQTERLKAIQAEVQEARRTHAGDREARQRAVTEIYERERVNPALSCLPPVVAAAVPQLPAIWSPLNQTLPERLAGIVVVFDD